MAASRHKSQLELVKCKGSEPQVKASKRTGTREIKGGVSAPGSWLLTSKEGGGEGATHTLGFYQQSSRGRQEAALENVPELPREKGRLWPGAVHR